MDSSNPDRNLPPNDLTAPVDLKLRTKEDAPLRSLIAFLATLMFALTPGLVLSQAIYQNPVDGQTYAPSGGFETALPDHRADDAGKKVVTKKIILLTVDNELKQRVTLPELTRFIKSAQGAAYKALAPATSPAEVLVQFNCAAKKCTVRIANRGSVDRAILQALYDALSQSSPLDTKDEVVFQIDFSIRV